MADGMAAPEDAGVLAHEQQPSAAEQGTPPASAERVAELGAMKLRALVKKAEELGVSEDQLNDAEEKSDIITLIVQKRHLQGPLEEIADPPFHVSKGSGKVMVERVGFDKLSPEHRKPLGTMKLPNGVLFTGPGDYDVQRQRREARHWLQVSRAQRIDAMSLLVDGTLKPRKGAKGARGDIPAPKDGDDEGYNVDGYMWPQLTYATTTVFVRYHEHAPDRGLMSKDNKRHLRQLEAAKQRQLHPDRHAPLGKRFMCVADFEKVKEAARLGEWAGGEQRTLGMADLVTLVKDVLRARPEEQRSANANKLMLCADPSDGKDPVTNRPLIGLGLLREVRKATAAFKPRKPSKRRRALPSAAAAAAAATATATAAAAAATATAPPQMIS